MTTRCRFLVLATAGLFATMLISCVQKPRGLQGPSVKSIESATTIAHPNERLHVLENIADRRNLTPSEQIYLVNAVLMGGGFSPDQADALITLIENPVCTPETRAYIREQLKYHRLGISKQLVVNALEAAQKPETRPASP